MEKDLRSNAFFSDNERYADIINGFGCEGETVGSERMSRLIIVLTEQGRQEDLLKAAKDSRYREELLEELII